MSLDSLMQGGYIKKLPISKSKVEDALSLAKRDITTAKSILEENSDWSTYVFKRMQANRC